MTTSLVEQDQRDVIATVERMTAAFQRCDLDGVMATYEEAATVSFEPERPISEPSEIRAQFQGLFQLRPIFEYSGHEVVVLGDTAVHFAPWTMRATTPDGATIEQRGLSVAVLRRQRDGRWLMIIDNPHGQRLIDAHGYPC